VNALAAPPIGALSDRVQLKRRDATTETEGGHVATFVPLATVWARVRSLAGRQGQTSDGRTISLSHVVVLRFRTDLGPGDRVVYRGHNLEVVSAADLNGSRAYLSCLCAEVAVVG
jgi:SPP1 family predicted phage head-tail adaptor